MSHERIATKIHAYRSYHDAGTFKQKYPAMQSFHVVVVTESRRRADGLRIGLEHLIPSIKLQRAYRFIALHDLTLDALLPKAAGV